MKNVNIKLKDFDLKKVRAVKDSVTVVFHTVEAKPGKDEHFEHVVTGDRQPHPDLLEAMAKLKDPLLRSLRLIQVYETAAKYLKGDQKKKVTEAWNNVYQTLEFTGISWSGKDALAGVVLSGKYENDLEGKSPVNSPRLCFSSDKLGYEKIVEKQVELVRIEVYKYLFEGKSAQLQLAFSKEEEIKTAS